MTAELLINKSNKVSRRITLYITDTGTSNNKLSITLHQHDTHNTAELHVTL